jgi:hypothetical protein
MNRSLLLAFALGSATGAGAATKLDTDLYAPASRSTIDEVGLIPSGSCSPDGGGITGPVDGTCFETTAVVRLLPVEGREKLGEHTVTFRAPTNKDTAAALGALLDGVAIPALAQEEPLKSNADLFEAPALKHVVALRVIRPGGPEPRLHIEANVPSLRPGLGVARLISVTTPPQEALDAVLALGEQYVVADVNSAVLKSGGGK